VGLHRLVVIAAIAAVLATALTACYHGDWQIRIRNDTSQAWYIKIDSPTSGMPAFVNRVEPGANGVGVSWQGEATKPIDVLDLACDKVATFHTVDGTSYVIDAVPGLVGTVEPYSLGNDGTGLKPTTDCGGFLFS
jgi:hypothetical protein